MTAQNKKTPIPIEQGQAKGEEFIALLETPPQKHLTKIGKYSEPTRAMLNETSGIITTEFQHKDSVGNTIIVKAKGDVRLTVQEQQAFDLIISTDLSNMHITKDTTVEELQGIATRAVYLPKYAEDRGFTGKNALQTARKELKSLCEKLRNDITFCAYEETGADTEKEHEIKFIETYEQFKDGHKTTSKKFFEFEYGYRFLCYLRNTDRKPLKLIPLGFYAIDQYHEPAFEIGKALYEHYRRAYRTNSANTNCIAVCNVLKDCNSIQKYEDIKDTRQAKQRIIDRFIDNLGTLEDKHFFKSFYFTQKGQNIKYDYVEARKFKYSEFENLLLHFEISDNYPYEKAEADKNKVKARADKRKAKQRRVEQIRLEKSAQKEAEAE